MKLPDACEIDLLHQIPFLLYLERELTGAGRHVELLRLFDTSG